MEFLRFGSSIPGEYWGCCACCIIQNFNQHPDTKASIQLVSGDGGGGMTVAKELAFAGPTLRDIFETRIRIGTFSTREMPNHAFLAILSQSQMSGDIGKAWLEIFKANGFEFVRTVNNSVWNVNNYIFGLFRNVGPNAVKDQFLPPKAWTDIKSIKPEPALLIDGKKVTAEQVAVDKAIWEKGKTNILPESAIVKAGAPVIMAGLRSEFPPEKKATRDEKMAKRKELQIPYQPSSGTQYFY